MHELPATGRRLLAVQEAHLRGAAEWPPAEPLMLSLLDQHGQETTAWREAHSDSVASESIFTAWMSWVLLWRRALDAGEDGTAQRAMCIRLLEALSNMPPST